MFVSFRFLVSVSAGIFLVPLLGCSVRTDNSQDEPTQSQSELTPEDIASSLRPQDEANLLNMPQQAEDQLRKSPNDYRTDQIEDEWASRWCNALKNVRIFKDWTGVLSSVDAGHVEVSLGWTLNFVDNMTVSSPIFQQASNLKQGTVVRVSGSIDRESVTCGNWSDVGYGDQEVHFSSIMPISDGVVQP